MALVRGLSADTSWRGPLARSSRATVESSFEHALNLEVDDGSLLTVVTRSGRPAPGALVSTATVLPRIAAGTDAVIGERLTVGPLVVDLGTLRWFDCLVGPLAHTAWASSARFGADRAVHALEAARVDAEPRDAHRTGAAATPFERALAARLDRASDDYLRALRAGVGADRAARGLIGLGIGLTPTGDDYLVGSLAVLHLMGTRRLVADIDAAIREAGETTTRVGRHFLTAAARGRFHHDIHLAAEATITDDPRLDARFAAVAAIGSTSGTDTLAGLVDTVAALAPLIQHARKEALS